MTSMEPLNVEENYNAVMTTNLTAGTMVDIRRVRRHEGIARREERYGLS
jgi:hypothetical protein